MQDKDKEAAVKIRNAIKDSMRTISEHLVELSKLHGGDGYQLECQLNVIKGIATGQLSGKAFKIVDGQLVYLPADDTPDESQSGNLQTTAAAEVEAILKKLGIGDGK